MAKLSQARRARMKKSEFAYVDKYGEGHLPIHDESHVRNAVARWNQTHFEDAAAKEAARKAILAAARRHNVTVAKDDEILR